MNIIENKITKINMKRYLSTFNSTSHQLQQSQHHQQPQHQQHSINRNMSMNVINNSNININNNNNINDIIPLLKYGKHDQHNNNNNDNNNGNVIKSLLSLSNDGTLINKNIVPSPSSSSSTSSITDELLLLNKEISSKILKSMNVDNNNPINININNNINNNNNINTTSMTMTTSTSISTSTSKTKTKYPNSFIENENNASSIIEWAYNKFDNRIAMSTSFGIQSSVLLHMATRIMPDIPIVWVDTGYLPKETYQYAEELKELLNLNLITVSNTEWTPARMEAIYGKLWELNDKESHKLYGKLRKIIPLQNGLDLIKSKPLALLSGLRSEQTKARSKMDIIGYQNNKYKILPMLKMSDNDINHYMDKYDLPKHPLQSKGYVTVGDWHSSRPIKNGEDARSTRFGGKFEECGLHVDESEKIEKDKMKIDDVKINNIVKSVDVDIDVQTSKDVNVQTNKDINIIKQEILIPSSIVTSSSSSTSIIPTTSSTSTSSNTNTNIIIPGLESLYSTKPHNDTGLAVIMVKKILEDGSICRKCQDVSDKLISDGIDKYISYTAIANMTQKSSEGIVLAKQFDVVTAPFFLVRTQQTQSQSQLSQQQQQNHHQQQQQQQHDSIISEWKPVRSYLQIKKMILNAQDKNKQM